MISQNTHLNLFRFFNENESDEYLENNLSRALAICLQREPAFLLGFLKEILKSEEQSKVLSTPPHEDRMQINIQQRVDNLGITNVQTVYAVAMSGEDFDVADYQITSARNNTDNPITDLTIGYKDILIIIEVKRTQENCLAQLKEQVEKTLVNADEDNKPTVHFTSFSWKRVTKLCQEIDHLHQLMSQPYSYCGELYQLIATRFSEWLNTRPFAYINYKNAISDSERWVAEERFRQAMKEVKEIEPLPSNDRFAWKVDFNWANEVVATFELGKQDNIYLTLTVYPGNTKGQGSYIFTHDDPTAWMNEKKVQIGEDSYDVHHGLHIKLTGFQGKYISGLFVYQDDERDLMERLKKYLYTQENYREKSGRYKREQWPSFCELFDDAFPTDYDWRDKVDWENKFEKSGRTEFSVSFGFMSWINIPYKKLQELDKKDEKPVALGAYLEQAVYAMGNLIP